MSAYSSTNGLHQIIGYGSNSVVVAHNPNHSHTGCHHYHAPAPPVQSRPPPPPKAVSCYQLLPIVHSQPIVINVAVQQSTKKEQSPGNHIA